MNGADDRASTTNTPAVQCRGLLAGAAALSDAGDDAELIRLGRDFASRHQTLLELAARHDDAVVPVPTDLATAAGAMHAVAEAMAEVPGAHSAAFAPRLACCSAMPSMTAMAV